jgi:hypothetical protein
MQMNGVNYVGPWGGGGGDPFDSFREVQPLPDNFILNTPIIRSGDWLDALTVVYWDKGHTQNQIYSRNVGGDGGGITWQPTLRVGEFIIGAVGRTGNYVDHLDLVTNFTLNLNFGGGGGAADFQFFVEDPATEEIIGFFGRAHTYIDAIGFVVRKRQ